MNTPIRLVFAVMFLSVLSFPSSRPASADSRETPEKPRISLNEISLGSGYVKGSFKFALCDYSVTPVFIRVGFDISPLVGLEGRTSSLQLAFEPFINSIQGTNKGIEAGSSIGVRYLKKIARSVDLFTEGSVAPMSLGIDTWEQGRSGFNFLDQIGGGLQYKFFENSAFFFGYRLRHISNANLFNRHNAGINSQGFIGGISWLY